MEPVTDASPGGPVGVEVPSLGAVFPTPTLEQWRTLVDRVLDRTGTADPVELERRFNRQLITTTYDGIRLTPLYTDDDVLPEMGTPGAAPYVRGRTAIGNVVDGWDVRQATTEVNAQAANDAILAELTGGATSVLLRVGQGGLPVAELGAALAGVHLELAGIALEAWSTGEQLAAVRSLVTLWREQLDDPKAALGSLGLDPIGETTRTGKHVDLAQSIEFATEFLADGGAPGVTVFVADGRPVHDAGGSPAEELGYVLAVGTAYLRALLAAGVPVDVAASAIELRLSATADQFATIATVRAARRTWSRITEVAGASDHARAPRIHAVTSWAMVSRRDPWVNLLRTTVAAFAAGSAGADSVTVLPFDVAIGRPDAFGRRLARNIQALLIEESNVARVIDPAGGSWFVEALTDEICEVAWTFFQEIEDAATAGQGHTVVAERVEATRAARADEIAHRREPLTGVSEFPDVHEAPVERPADTTPPGGGLPRERYAEPFEVLRDRADAAAAAGSEPTVALVTIGSAADFTARATFAKNLFEAGGVRTSVIAVDDLVSGAASLPNNAIVCLCSSDALYGERVADAAKAARDGGATYVLLAGAPRKNEEAWRAAGVDEFIAVGVDVLDVLERTLDRLGVAR